MRAAAERVRIEVGKALAAKDLPDVFAQVALDRVVTLRGRVDSPEHAAEAVAIATAVPGVTRVETRVVVLR